MSAKWRAMQHRHRYTYSAVIFPPSYIDSLSPLSSNPNFLSFFNELSHFTSLTSIYSQVTEAKTLASSFTSLLNSLHVNGEDGYLVESASRAYLELLFLENSLPLHRTLVSALSKISDFDVKGVVVKCFRELCDECGAEKRGNKRFCLSRVALSVMGMQKLGFLVGVVEDCAVFVCRDVVLGLESVVLETQDCARPSPIVLEQCQESLSCLYYLLQRFPGKFKSGVNGFDGEELVVMNRVLEVLIRLLKSSAFSRDCFVAAGVSLCAALQVCLSAEELGLFISEGIFNLTSCSFSGDGGNSEFRNATSKIPFNGNLCLEIRSFSVLSRICLIRGILTAVSRTVLNNHFVLPTSDLGCNVENGNFGGIIRTILYDGVLPELCNYCENPIDSHFNFHALTVLQICLQQMKTSILGNLTELLDNYDPLPEEMGTRILRIIWNNLEDPLSQTVKQVNLIFDLFLDIHSTIHCGGGSERIKSFLQKIASDLLRLGPRCKGRYVPLASLTKRLGAKAMLDMCPNLLFETAQAYVDDDVCCAATNFLKCFLECLRDECWNINGVEEGYIVYRGYCLPPFLYGLASGVSKLRSNLNTYALSVLLDLDMDSVFPMLAFISVGPSDEENGSFYPELSETQLELGVEQKVAILVSLLKVCRSLAIIEGDIDFCDDSSQLTYDLAIGEEIVNRHAVVCIKGIKYRVPVEWLVFALIHVDESLRVDAAETLFLNPKTSSLPSHLELILLKEAVPLNMRSCSTSFQMKWTSLFRKFFSRVRTALDRYFKQGMWQPLKNGDDIKACISKGTDETIFSKAEDLFNFMKWLCCFLFFSCYPSAPYKRKIMAMDLILIMLSVWPLVLFSRDKSELTSFDSFVCPYSKGITSPESTLLLVGSIVDSWDRLRESSFRILLYFPTPLPGFSSYEMVEKVITWAKKLVCSPRVRESDAGALTLRLIFRKYVLDLGWIVRASSDGTCSHLQNKLLNGHSQITESRPPVVEYIRSLIDWLNASVEEAERDLSEACKNSFVHGVLLALRYTCEELEWDSDAVTSCIPEMRLALEKLLELVMRITSLALWVVSADAWYLQDVDEIADDDDYLVDELEGDEPSLVSEGTNNSKQVQDNRPTEQIVMVGCWLAMKEVSLLLGTIIRKIPLPTCCSDSLDSGSNFSGVADKSTLTTSEAMINFKQLQGIGNHFLEVLLKMKHNGAIDKTRAGFTALCNRLLCSNDPRLCMLTESWMDQLMARTVAKGQTVDDLLRRSAGIPAAFIALFLSEPEGSPKKLLPRALRWLIDVASGTLLGQVNANDLDVAKFSSTVPGEEVPDSEQLHEMNTVEKNSKIRDEGVIPTVHAFNALRASFNDTNLATDTSGFAAEALILSIRSFSSPYWEVRNSACLAYTALVRRMIGFLNVQKRESARRALTGLEFFNRYPSLHPFFYNEMKAASDLLSTATSGSRHPGSDLAKAVHPSLCPMLILLSRLKPSTIASESGDDLDPFLFMPFIRRCSTQSNLRIRVLASRALVSLVSNEKLQTVILNIASELHCSDDKINNASFSAYSATHRLSFNSIHGMLLQLSSLLDANCRNLADSAKKEEILSELIRILGCRSWIAKPKWCPCPILNASFLRVLDHMLSIARMGHMSENFYAIRDLLLELSIECLDAEYSDALPCYDPTIAELREQAAISYFSCVHEAAKDEVEEILQAQLKHPLLDSKLLKPTEAETAVSSGLQERLISCLLDSSYEVRLATLKWLLKFLKSADSNGEGNRCCSHEIKTVLKWNKSNLQPTMMRLLESENHHRCILYILRILVAWNSLQNQQAENDESNDIMYVGNLSSASVFHFWGKLTSLYKLTRHTKSRETLICCMAVCVKYFASSLSSYVLAKSDKKTVNSCQLEEMDKAIHLYEYVAFFVNLIKEHSSASEQVTMRNAVAEAIVLSGLLEQAELLGSSEISLNTPENPGSRDDPKDSVHAYACQLQETWFCCIKLLEDEDDGIRQRLALNVQKSFSFSDSRSKSSAGVVPTQVEKVIEQSFHHLSSVFGHWIHYFDYLAQWVLNAANYALPSGDIVRRVFDKEIDNHHEEKLLVCQICCSHMEKLPILQSAMTDVSLKTDFHNYLHRWRTRFFDQLMSFAEGYVRSLGGLEWIGGVGNHKDAFLPLYTNLLGFYALSNCIVSNSEQVNDMPLPSEVAELDKVMNPFLSNALISNLYLLVVKSHQKDTSAEAGQSDCKLTGKSVWDSFNPYFLLG